MLPVHNFDALLEIRRRPNSSLSLSEGSSIVSHESTAARSSAHLPTTLVLVDDVLPSFQALLHEPKIDNSGVSGSMIQRLASIRATSISGSSQNAPSLSPRNQTIGVDDGLFEPLPLKEQIIRDDDSSVRNKKLSLNENSKLMSLASYTASLDDPFAPRPIMETDCDALTYTDDKSFEDYNHSSMSSMDTESIDTDFEDDQDYDANNYLEIAHMLRAEHDGEASHPSKRARPLPQYELNTFEEVEVTHSSRPGCPSTPPPSPELRSENGRVADVACRSVLSPQGEVTERQLRPMDAYSIMERLDQLMFQSEVTQAALQYFDKRRGLPKSHCQTMVNSSRSRKQLLEGRIIKKWNGRPLLGEDSADVTSVVSEAGPRRRRRKRKQVTKPLAPQNDNDMLEEDVLSEDTEDVEKREKPKRRMSAPR